MQCRSEPFIKNKIESCLILLCPISGRFSGERISCLGEASVEIGTLLLLMKIQINTTVMPTHISNVESEQGWKIVMQ